MRHLRCFIHFFQTPTSLSILWPGKWGGYQLASFSLLAVQIFCNACCWDRIDGRQYGLAQNIRVCDECKAFEQKVPSLTSSRSCFDVVSSRKVVDHLLQSRGATSVPLAAWPLTKTCMSEIEAIHLSRLQSHFARYYGKWLRACLACRGGLNNSVLFIEHLVTVVVNSLGFDKETADAWGGSLLRVTRHALSRVCPQVRGGFM